MSSSRPVTTVNDNLVDLTNTRHRLSWAQIVDYLQPALFNISFYPLLLWPI
jgi:hypothetical protein